MALIVALQAASAGRADTLKCTGWGGRWEPWWPPADTPVVIDTDFGTFRLPFGYTTARGFLLTDQHNVPIWWLPPSSLRLKERYRFSTLGFVFWLPDGTVVQSNPGGLPGMGFRPCEPGHPQPVRDHVAVYVDMMFGTSDPHLAYRKRWIDLAAAQQPDAFDVLKDVVVSDSVGNLHFGYGAIRVDDQGHTGKFVLDCGLAPNCEVYAYFDEWAMTIHFYMPRDAQELTFAAVAKAASLLREWKAAASAAPSPP
ncbi:MAG TPA: hypothetical protein VKS60_09220 [Stellaceae bacterium]|nr:hypothetical protein [Stellaceae bacterium]